MSTPQEKRFVHLAVAKHKLSREQAVSAAKYKNAKAEEGRKIPLWHCAVLCDFIDPDTSERLWNDAGDLPVEQLGDFRLLRKLGQGGMGTVWLGLGPDKKRAAIKVLSPELSQRRTLVTRFLREADACRKLEHENIVRGYAAGEDEGYYYFAMEFVEGQSVKQMLEASGAMRHEDATLIVREVAEGLRYAHDKGIVHRDIKPDNIMVTPAKVAKLMDLGLAHNTDPELTALTKTGTSMGTPYYMAPEQISNAKAVDARSDIYSLGATWYHMVTGRVPFEGDTPIDIMRKQLSQPAKPAHSVRPAVPLGVSQTIDRMMAKDPSLRMQTAEELCNVIDARCLGKRDIVQELGVGRKAASDTMWEMKILVNGRMEKRRMTLDQVRERYRRGQVTRETPTRRAGIHGVYSPAREFLELDREVFRDYAVTVQKKKSSKTHYEMVGLMEHFDEEERKYRRRKFIKRMRPWLIQAAVFLVVAVLVYAFWPQISAWLSNQRGSGSSAAVSEE